MLDKIINLYSFTTSSFYSNREKHLHDLNMTVRSEKNLANEMIAELEAAIAEANTKGVGVVKFEKYNRHGKKKQRVFKIDILYLAEKPRRIENEIQLSIDQANEMLAAMKASIPMKTAVASRSKEQLTTLLAHKAEHNIATNGKDHIRQLRADATNNDNRIISTFDSFLTRTIGCKPDQITDEICSLTVFYFDVFKDLLYHGFIWNGEKYVYYTSSAGMIRTKRGTFIKESTLKKIEATMMCGLTVDKINEMGGNNVNKHLAYLALTNSATDEWTDFDIDKCIVVDDFERMVSSEVDYIDSDDFSITRQEMDIPIPCTDGVGMMLPSVSQKNFMVRLPWVKGLLAVFNFRAFIKERGCSPIIKDIYGQEHDVIAEDIQIILNKSQFKMYKYYSSWQDYKDNFKANNCRAGICNVEEDYIKNSRINYQMIQDLLPTDEEIAKLIDRSKKKIEDVSKNYKTIRNIMGLDRYDTDLTPFQQALKIYPPLLRDRYTKDTVRQIKDSLLKKYRSGKIEVSGKYTFIVPDMYAVCEYLFEHNNDPAGLLANGEVSCRMYSKSDELDCLRAPHIYYEHGIRKNIVDREDMAKWFTTDALYVSCNDVLSIVLMFDDRNQCRTV